ncbi:MAG: nitrogenase iron protein [Desulfuromonadales bacterium]|nr:nitrogenase iron protein [Desulfuromonadales bacterium]
MKEHILFYGKGGVGTSTLISNVSAALTEAGFRIMQVGCGPVSDSCSTLHGGLPVPSISDLLRGDGRISPDNAVQRGFKGIATVEFGAPDNQPGLSTSEGLRRIFDAIEQERIFESVPADYVLHDISGESSFAAYYEILNGLGATRIFIVTSADYMSLSAANSIFESLERFGDARTPIPFGGLIPNGVSSSFEDSFFADFAHNTSTRVLGRVPRSLMVRQCELYGKTVIEASPLSNQSYFYRRLANQIVDVAQSTVAGRQPSAMSPERIREWAHEWADRLYALENGLVSDGAAI